MSRVTALFCGAAAVGLAFATADWKCIPVSGSYSTRLGRVEAPHVPAPAASLPADGAALDPASGGGVASGDPATLPVRSGGEPATGRPPTPDPKTVEPPPAPPAREPDRIEIDDVTLCVADNCDLPDFPVSGAVRLQLTSEGELFWVTSAKSTALPNRESVLSSVRRAADRPVLLIADADTAWQYLKDAFDVADNAGADRIYLGVASAAEPKILRVLRLWASPTTQGGDGDFVVHLSGDDATPEITIGDTDLESFPADLAIAWNEWRGAHPAAQYASAASSNVVLDIHRFTSMRNVAAVLGVLRGLGVGAERYTAVEAYAGRKRR